MQGNTIPNTPLQLYDGLAGLGLYLLGMLDDRHKSWLQLL